MSLSRLWQVYNPFTGQVFIVTDLRNARRIAKRLGSEWTWRPE